MARTITFQFTATVGDEVSDEEVTGYVADALKDGCGYLDEDTDTHIDGLISDPVIVSVPYSGD